MVTPEGKKSVARHLIKGFKLSERAACSLAGVSRTAFRYVAALKRDTALRTRLKELAAQYPRYGYLMLHSLLKSEGLVVNRKHTYRLYTEESLQVRTKKRKKLTRPRMPMEIPTATNQRWSMDFVSDQLSSGRRFRVLHTHIHTYTHIYTHICTYTHIYIHTHKCIHIHAYVHIYIAISTYIHTR